MLVRLCRVAGVLLVALVAATLPLSGSLAQEEGPSDPDSLEALVDVFGVQNVPVDVVVVVDTSTSMVEDGAPPPWPGVVEGYSKLVDSLGPSDNLGLITFDSVAGLRHALQPLTTDAERSTAKGQLPSTPTGTATDIGAALEATLEELRRSSTDLQLVFFMTDGLHSPTPASPFQAPEQSKAWAELEAEGDQYSEANGDSLEVFGWGAGGEGSTDIGLVKSVFPDAVLLAIPTQQVPVLLESLSREAARERVRPGVKDDLESPIEATLEVQGQLQEQMPGTLVFTNSRSGLTTNIDFQTLRVTEADGSEVRAEFEPQQLRLAPGESTRVPVVLYPAETERSWITIGLRSDTREWKAEVGAETSLNEDLTALLSTERLADPAETVGMVGQPAPVEVGTTWGISVLTAVIVAVLLVLLCIALFFFLKWMFVPPSLKGRILTAGQEEYRLRGKRVTLPNARVGTPGGEQEVELFTKPRGQGKWVFIRKGRGEPTIDGADVPINGIQLFGGEKIVLDGKSYEFRRLDQ